MVQLNLMEQKFLNYQFQLLQNLDYLRTFQQTRIYGKLNCIENMLISHKPENDGILTVFQKIPSDLTDKAETLLKFVGFIKKENLEQEIFHLDSKNY